MGKYSVILTNEPVVVIIGERSNNIQIRVDNTTTKSVATDDEKAKITLQVGFGEKASDLLNPETSAVDVSYKAGVETKGLNMNIINLPPEGKKAWECQSSLPATICLDKFMSNAVPGNAEIFVAVQGSGELEKFSITNVVKKVSKYSVSLNSESGINMEKDSNAISISVERTKEWEACNNSETVRITVHAGFGEKEKDLLLYKTDFVEARFVLGGKNADEEIDIKWASMIAVLSKNSDQITWDTGIHKITLPASICLRRFMTNVSGGYAKILVRVQGDGEPEEHEIPVKKISPVESAETGHVPLFVVTPGLFMPGGNNAVTIRFFYAKECDSVVLYRNNERLRVWMVGHEKSISGYYQDSPSITSVYRLVRYKENVEKIPAAPEQIVQVMSTGWNQVGLPQGSPIRLFVAKDFAGGETNRLYGIFYKPGQKNKEDKLEEYMLYSSPTGVDSWRLEDGRIPQHMATSPGVVYKNKLWLIGGSSVDPNKPNNEIYCYENKRWVKKSNFIEGDLPSSIMPPRMGHACIVFSNIIDSKEEIWVFGGYTKTEGAFNDLWIARENKFGDLDWSRKPIKCDWDKRLKHAAVTVKNPKGKNEVWIYGGAEVPQTENNMCDLWKTDNGMKWVEMKQAIDPSPGKPIGCALATYQAGVSSSDLKDADMVGDRLFLMGSFRETAPCNASPQPGNRISSFIFGWKWGNDIWETNPVINGWQQFDGNNFYMQAIGFNGCLFVYSLIESDDESKIKTKLNIMIP